MFVRFLLLFQTEQNWLSLSVRGFLIKIPTNNPGYVILAVIWRFSQNIASYVRIKMNEWDFSHSKLEELYPVFGDFGPLISDLY
jgi:hypothetical protein